MLINNPVLTGSFTLNGVNVAGITGSSELSSSFLTVSASYATTSASFAATSQSVSSRVTKIEGNYATTGSNAFNGSQNITGSLTISQAVIAQTLNVQQVTSSIVYSCGSNTFGCALTDVQQFTGSVRITGSLSTIGNACVSSICSPSFVGGTISGLNAAFSCDVCITKTSSFLKMGNSTNNSYGAIQFLGNACGQGNTFGELDFYNKVTGADVLSGQIEIAHDSTSADNKSYMAFRTHNGTALTTPLYISSAGNVGINCTNPQAKLDIVRGSSGDNLRLVGSGASDYSDVVIYATDNVTRLGYIDFSNTQARINVEANIPLILYTSGSERLRITSDGNINIGNSSTTGKKLIVNQGGTTGYFLSGEASCTELAYWYYNSSEIQFSSKSATRSLSILTSDATRLSISNTGIACFACQVCVPNLYASSDSRICGNLQVAAGSATSIALYNAGSIRGCLSMTGNEGDLSLYGSSANKTVYLSAYYDSYFIGNGGTAKVGIGTSLPCSKLHVAGGGIVIDNNQDYRSLNSSGVGRTILYLDSSNRLLLNNDDGLIRISTCGNIRTCFVSTGETVFACQICTPGVNITSNPIGVEYLIVAGGGAGGWDVGGGGGAGGVLQGSTGLYRGTYNVSIGAGGAGTPNGTSGGYPTGSMGNSTYAIGLTAVGGGGGGNYVGCDGGPGASGGGGAGYGATTVGGAGMYGSGFKGGDSIAAYSTNATGGGGGGAGGVGCPSANSNAGCTPGGPGILSTIIGVSTSYGCGGRGGGDSWSGPTFGPANTGYGGDGAGGPTNTGCSGGSGIFIIKMLNSNSATFSVGLTTATCTNIKGYNMYVVTAGTGTMTIS